MIESFGLLGLLPFLFAFGGGGTPSAPPPPAAPPSKSDAQVQAEVAAARMAAKKRKGRASTILTGDTRAAGFGADTELKDTLG